MSSVNATSSYCIYEQCRTCEQYSIREQCQISFYTPPKVFDRCEFKNTICFTIHILVSCEMGKISLKYIKYLNYNKSLMDLNM